MDQDHRVYDDDSSGEPITRPDLHAMESGEEQSAADQPDTTRSSEAGKKNKKRGFFNRGGDSGGAAGEVASSLSGAEKGNSSGEANFSFNPHDKNDRGNIKKVLKAAGGNRKGLMVGGGAAAGIIGLVFVVFFMLIPLKIEHIVSNLEKRFTSTSQDAVSRTSERMLSKYVKKHVLPALTQCSGTTLDKNCNPHFGNSNNPVDALYKGWSDARLENKLATKYGIEFKAVKHGSVTKYYMKGPGVGNPNGDDITKFTKGNLADGNLFEQVSRGNARQYVRDTLKKETRWHQVMFRFKVGRLLEEKYGVKRCMVFCGTKDALADYKNEKSNAAKIFLTQRVITPRTDTLGIVMECIMNPSCNPEDTQPTTPQDGTTAENNGAPENPDTDTAVRTHLEELAGTYGITDKTAIEKMIKDYKDISEKGYQKVVLEKILQKVGLGELSSTVADKAFIVGWVNEASKLIGSLSKLGPSVKKLGYVTNATAAVSLYMAYRTYADEVHTGHVDATEIGSFTQSLGPGDHGDNGDPIVGGTASAESTPLYGAIIDGKSGTSTSLINSLLPSSYADSSSPDSNYLCRDKKPPQGIVCPEEKLGGGNKTADEISNTLHTAPLSYITDAANVWNSTAGKIFGVIGDIFGSLIGHIPGVSSLTDFIGKAVQPFFKFLTDQLIPNPFGTNMSGGRKFDMMAAGANVAGNDACEQVGCQAVDPSVVARIVNQQEAEDRQSFSHRPIFARLFDTSSSYSLVSRMAMAMPIGSQAAAQSGFASLLSSPIAAMTHGFGSIFSSHQAYAASDASVDPFNIGTTAFPENKIPADPEAYWDAHNCGDTSENGPIAKWQKAAADAPTNPETGMPVHYDVEPCLLIKNTVGDVGGIYDTSLLNSDEQSVLSGNLPGN